MQTELCNVLSRFEHGSHIPMVNSLLKFIAQDPNVINSLLDVVNVEATGKIKNLTRRLARFGKADKQKTKLGLTVKKNKKNKALTGALIVTS